MCERSGVDSYPPRLTSLHIYVLSIDGNYACGITQMVECSAMHELSYKNKVWRAVLSWIFRAR